MKAVKIKKLEEYKQYYLKTKEETNKFKDVNLSHNLYPKWHYDSIERDFNILNKIKEYKLSLERSVAEMKSRFNAGDKQISDKDIKIQETIL